MMDRYVFFISTCSIICIDRSGGGLYKLLWVLCICCTFGSEIFPRGTRTGLKHISLLFFEKPNRVKQVPIDMRTRSLSSRRKVQASSSMSQSSLLHFFWLSIPSFLTLDFPFSDMRHTAETRLVHKTPGLACLLLFYF